MKYLPVVTVVFLILININIDTIVNITCDPPCNSAESYGVSTAIIESKISIYEQFKIYKITNIFLGNF
ncbi:MAG TPA: hypothetical protein PKG60_13825 [Spirochaetota bacterium]|nr:hypothetical protein [Spirochaetota bacterium]